MISINKFILPSLCLFIFSLCSIEAKSASNIVSNEYEQMYELSDDDICLLALLTLAEAEGEPELGQRLVIDTVLNRVDSNSFPNTVQGVVYQKYQFTSIWNGRIQRCNVKEELINLVIEELNNRTNRHCLYFQTMNYSKYGSPLFKVGRHYFSGA